MRRSGRAGARCPPRRAPADRVAARAPHRALCCAASECRRVRWMQVRRGGPMASADGTRHVQRAPWAGLSASWEKWDSVIMKQLGPVGAAMIERLDIADDHQHLDI